MSERDEDDESQDAEGRESSEEKPAFSPDRLLRVGGVVLVAIGALVRLASPRGSGGAVAGAVVGLLGAAVIVASRFFRADGAAPVASADPAAPVESASVSGYHDDGARIDALRGGRIATAIFGALACLIGLGLLLDEALSQEQRGNAWPFVIAGAVALVAAGIWSAAIAPQPRGRGIAAGPPTGASTRAWIAGAVGALLVIEALIPLRYYTGDDIFDERFSWRMFSAVRVYSCNLNAFETRGGAEAPVNLMSTIHVGWITTLRRNREAVMERYLEWRCEQDSVEAARLVNVCTTPEGNRVPDVVRTIDCAEGRVERGAE